jgi:hypothetical protein
MTHSAPTEGVVPEPPSRKTLLLITSGGFLAAAVIAVLFVLPAEMHVDPTGFGHITGLDRLAGPKTVKLEQAKSVAGAGAVPAAALVHYYPAPYRSDVFDIPLASSETDNVHSELEYKVRMKAGDSLVYSWTVTGITNPEEFYSDFHGETPAQGSTPAKVVEYRQSTGLSNHGALTAPIPGVHGWYLQNQAVGPAVVHLKLSGFYELVPPGQYGNLGGIKPKSGAK